MSWHQASIRFSAIAIMFTALALSAVPAAMAESPVIAQQQLKYRIAKQKWEEKHIPTGLSNARAFAKREKQPNARASGTDRTAMLLENVDFSIADDIGFSVKKLILTLEPKKRGAPVDFDKVDSFTIRLQSGEIVLRSSALTALFNKHVLDYPGHSLANMKMKIADGRLSATGTMVLCNCLGDLGIPSSFSGTISLTRDNKLAFKIDKIESFGFEVGDLLKSLGMSPATLINTKRPGVAMKGFTIELDHRKVFPFPEMEGNISHISMKSDGLHITFADAPNAKLNPPASLGKSFIWIQSGDPKFYGAIITNAKIALVSANKRKKLHFDLYGYRKLLSSAVAQLNTDGMLVVRIP